MRIELERTGGFAGRTVRWSLDTDELEPAEAQRIDALVTEAQSWAAPPAEGADRFFYRLRLLGDEEPVEVTFGDPTPDAARPLLALLRRSEPQHG